MWVELSKIVVTPESQARDGRLDDATVAAYAESMRSMGIERFPPVHLYRDGNVHYVGDGFHRIVAAKRAGFGNICAVVTVGTASDAVWHACAANQQHGLRRTNRDKMRAVRLAITHPNGQGKTTAEIARFVGVSDSMVARVRSMIAPTDEMRKRNARVRQLARESVQRAMRRPAPVVHVADAVRASEAVQDRALRDIWADAEPTLPYPGPAAVSQLAGGRVSAMRRIMAAVGADNPDAAADAVESLVKWGRSAGCPHLP